MTTDVRPGEEALRLDVLERVKRNAEAYLCLDCMPKAVDMALLSALLPESIREQHMVEADMGSGEGEEGDEDRERVERRRRRESAINEVKESLQEFCRENATVQQHTASYVRLVSRSREEDLKADEVLPWGLRVYLFLCQTPCQGQALQNRGQHGIGDTTRPHPWCRTPRVMSTKQKKQKKKKKKRTHDRPYRYLTYFPSQSRYRRGRPNSGGIAKPVAMHRLVRTISDGLAACAVSQARLQHGFLATTRHGGEGTITDFLSRLTEKHELAIGEDEETEPPPEVEPPEVPHDVCHQCEDHMCLKPQCMRWGTRKGNGRLHREYIQRTQYLGDTFISRTVNEQARRAATTQNNV